MHVHRLILIAVLLAVPFGAVARGEGITREQGEAILTELKLIRLLIEKQQQPAAVPTPAPAPQEQKVRLKLGTEFSIGRSDAPLVMVEFTDYQCPFCSRFYTGTFKELKKAYIDTGKLRYIARDLPLGFHPHALPAAQATRCAGEQDRFWQMKDLLMENSARLSPEVITTLAREAGLDMTRYQACMGSGRHLADIREGVTAAGAIGIDGTPSFVLGTMQGEILDGYRIVGAYPFAAFDAKLKELSAGKP
jgi:protein-disulfide isomerase